MDGPLLSRDFDLVSPDGKITHISQKSKSLFNVIVTIDKISPLFLGFSIDKESVFFNLKSTLAQLGINSTTQELELTPKLRSAQIKVQLHAIDSLGEALLPLLTDGVYIGKLFAADERRRVRNPEYLSRMFGRSDRFGRPLLTLGKTLEKEELLLEKIEGRTVAFLPLKEGRTHYDSMTLGFLPTVAKALNDPTIQTRTLLKLHQVWHKKEKKTVKKGELLLVNTQPLHIRTVFARVVDSLLPKGFEHTSASILQPDTFASGDVYELFGSSDVNLQQIPLEFYALHPYREHVFFADRDQLQNCIEQPKTLFNAMKTAPTLLHRKCAVFVVKGEQLLHLTPNDWISQESKQETFPGFLHPSKQRIMLENYIYNQPSYHFLNAIETGTITSEGILLSRYFPSPLMKRMFVSPNVLRCLKGLYFQYPSRSHGAFFSHEDRAFLFDLTKFGVPIFWLDEKVKNVLQYVPKPQKDSGMFVPMNKVETFIKSTTIGVYGSNLIEGDFEGELTLLLSGILSIQKEVNHPLLSFHTPLALVTGGGPGVMLVGNRVAKNLKILSCANIVDFTKEGEEKPIHEQEQNPFIEAKMTYRLDRLVERQAEFYLDLPIFLMGGIGTDFEFALEEVRRKIGISSPTPILLFGNPHYWKDKITSRFMRNLKDGTIEGSEWVSNCFYSVQNARQGLSVYRQFFRGDLPIGKKGPIYNEGFKIVS